MEIKKSFARSNGQIVEIEKSRKKSKGQILQIKNHFRNQTDKFWKSKKSCQKSETVKESKQIIILGILLEHRRYGHIYIYIISLNGDCSDMRILGLSSLVQFRINKTFQNSTHRRSGKQTFCDTLGSER